MIHEDTRNSTNKAKSLVLLSGFSLNVDRQTEVGRPFGFLGKIARVTQHSQTRGNLR
jgi:hypothetical protein